MTKVLMAAAIYARLTNVQRVKQRALLYGLRREKVSVQASRNFSALHSPDCANPQSRAYYGFRALGI
jgi:hypothetical protein